MLIMTTLDLRHGVYLLTVLTTLDEFPSKSLLILLVLLDLDLVDFEIFEIHSVASIRVEFSLRMLETLTIGEFKFQASKI